jgi:hypothetical protein
MQTIYLAENGKFIAPELGDNRRRTLRTLCSILTGVRQVRDSFSDNTYHIAFETMGWRVIADQLEIALTELEPGDRIQITNSGKISTSRNASLLNNRNHKISIS